MCLLQAIQSIRKHTIPNRKPRFHNRGPMQMESHLLKCKFRTLGLHNQYPHQIQNPMNTCLGS